MFHYALCMGYFNGWREVVFFFFLINTLVLYPEEMYGIEYKKGIFPPLALQLWAFLTRNTSQSLSN